MVHARGAALVLGSACAELPEDDDRVAPVEGEVAADVCTALDLRDPLHVRDALWSFVLLRGGFGTARLGVAEGDDACPTFTETTTGEVRTRTWQGGCTASTGVRFEGVATEVHRAMPWPALPAVRVETTGWRAEGLADDRFIASSGLWRSNREEDPLPEDIHLERFEGTLEGSFAELWAPHGVEVLGFEQLVERDDEVEWHTFSGTVEIRCRSVISGQVRVGKDERYRRTQQPLLGELVLTVDGRALAVDWSDNDGFGCYPVRVDGVVASTLCL